MKSNPVPDWTATWDRLALLRESLIQDMRQLLESGEIQKNGSDVAEPDGVKKARALYRTCMDTSKPYKHLLFALKPQSLFVDAEYL